MENEKFWAGLLMKSKKMRIMFSEFSDKMAEVIDVEFRKNKDLMSDWIQYPHVQNLPIEKMQKSKDYIPAEDGDIPIYYPKKALPNISGNTAQSKAKKHLKDMQLRNKEKKRQEQL